MDIETTRCMLSVPHQHKLHYVAVIYIILKDVHYFYFDKIDNIAFWSHGALKRDFFVGKSAFLIICFGHKPYTIPKCFVKNLNSISPINPLSAVGNYTVHGNLTFLWYWTSRTHDPLCNTLPSNNQSPKTVKIPALKGLNQKV